MLQLALKQRKGAVPVLGLCRMRSPPCHRAFDPSHPNPVSAASCMADCPASQHRMLLVKRVAVAGGAGETGTEKTSAHSGTAGAHKAREAV